MKFKTEEDLCKAFIEAHPRKEHLYFEAYVGGGRADIIHKETSIVTIYEAKLQLSVALLQQCIDRREYAHMVYAVVPKIKNSFMIKLFRDYGVGIITLRGNHHSYVSGNVPHILHDEVAPQINRKPKAIVLYEENKKEVAGSQSAGITPFSIMVDAIKKELMRRGDLKVDDIFTYQKYYGTLKQFKTNMYQWCKKGVIKDVWMEKGMMGIIK